MQRLDMTKGFPETFPFRKLTGPCFPHNHWRELAG